MASTRLVQEESILSRFEATVASVSDAVPVTRTATTNTRRGSFR